MAFFDVASNGTTGVVIAAASTGEKARFIALGITNNDTAQRMVTIYDGTAAAGTARARFALSAGSGFYSIIDLSGRSVLPKSWFTSGSAIEFALDGGTTGVRVWGEVVREA